MSNPNQNTNQNPRAQVQRVLDIGIQTANDAELQAAWDALRSKSEGWDSQDDIGVLMQIGAERWRRSIHDYSRSWLRCAEIAHAFVTETVSSPSGEWMPLWQWSDYPSFSQFAQDFLGLLPQAASQMRWVWEIFRVRLEKSEEWMVKVGKAKLGLVIPALRLATDTQDEERIAELLEALENDSFSVIFDKLQVANGKGAIIRFHLEHREDWEKVDEWTGLTEFLRTLKPNVRLLPFELEEKWKAMRRPPARLLHVSVSVNGQEFPEGIAMLIDGRIDPDDSKNITTKIGKALRWAWESEDAQEERVVPAGD
jgi:hypothetical protein